MKKTTKLAAIFAGAAAILTVQGCTDAQIGKFKNYGDPAEITCYSGTKLIYYGVSTGKIASEDSSDGYYLSDVLSNGSAEASGNCTTIYNPTNVNEDLYAEYKQNRHEAVDKSAIDNANRLLHAESTKVKTPVKTKTGRTR